MMFKVCMSVHTLLYTRTLGKQELNVQSCLDAVCLGTGCCDSKQCLYTVNCKDDTCLRFVFVAFLENLFEDTVVFLQIKIIWLWYLIAESLFTASQ